MQIEISAAGLRIGDKIIWDGGETTVSSLQKSADGAIYAYEAESQGGPPVMYDPGAKVRVRRGEEGQPRE